MHKLTRRGFVKGTLLTTAVAAASGAVHSAESDEPAGSPPDIIDVNVHLFDWPFRKLKYGQTRTLLAKLRKQRIVQAWAGSFEGCIGSARTGILPSRE
jgi:hypothetical protein